MCTRHPPNLSLKRLREGIKTVPHVKPRGRPKHTGTIWPSKRKGGKKLPPNKTAQDRKFPDKKQHREHDSGKENVSPNKRAKKSPVWTMGTPAYRARIKRESKRIAAASDPVAVDLTGDDEAASLDYEDTVLRISDVRISQTDMEQLKPGQWLNTSLINAGQALLRERFPEVHGLHDVLLSKTLSFQAQDCEFIQILNCANRHWVCISTIGCKPQVVNVYDSMRTGDVPFGAKESIATLLNCRSARNVYLVYPDVQQKTDGSSCGLFALAFAYTLCEGKDPSRATYCQNSLRSHFQSCLQEKSATSFESGRSLYNPGPFLKSRFKVYCTCRLPDSGDNMVMCSSCKEWYHYTCVGIHPGTKLIGRWDCTRCST